MLDPDCPVLEVDLAAVLVLVLLLHALHDKADAVAAVGGEQQGVAGLFQHLKLRITLVFYCTERHETQRVQILNIHGMKMVSTDKLVIASPVVCPLTESCPPCTT